MGFYNRRFLLKTTRKAPVCADNGIARLGKRSPDKETGKLGREPASGMRRLTASHRPKLPSGMRSRVSLYRVWIHAFNGTLTALSVVMAICTFHVLSQPRLSLFPVSVSDPAVFLIFVSIGAQIALIFIGTMAVCFTHGPSVKVYWIGMLAFLLSDIALGLFWVFKLRRIHLNYGEVLYSQWLEGVGRRQNGSTSDPGFCSLWRDVETSLGCCGPRRPFDYGNLSHFCTRELDVPNVWLPQSCCSNGTENCTIWEVPSAKSIQSSGCRLPLLLWFNSQTSLLALLGFGAIFTIKCIFLLILRREMYELTMEILHGRNKQLHNESWLAPDLDDARTVENSNTMTLTDLWNGLRKQRNWSKSAPASVAGDDTADIELETKNGQVPV